MASFSRCQLPSPSLDTASVGPHKSIAPNLLYEVPSLEDFLSILVENQRPSMSLRIRVREI